jgi:DNA-binding NtrC family response regulator
MMKKPKVLFIDDDKTFLELFAPLFEMQEMDVVPVASAIKALEVLANEPIDLVVSDVQMPEMTGVELFGKVQDTYPDIPVIFMTAFGNTELAIQAVKRGAFHFFEKPIYDKLDLFWTTVREALAKREMLKELASLQREKSLQMKAPAPIIGQSAAIKKVVRSIVEVAPLPITVLIYGETGTGKELVARAIHDQSDRRDNPFFAVNCTELAAGVLESELFGHEKGAFTGAINLRKGLFELAHQGTLFLDEISEASPLLQSKLLRVLETKTFMRVGGTTPMYSDFRILAATNCNLEADVAAGNFRQDLFYRLNVYTIEIPPLRERREDIPLIADFYLRRFCQTFRRPLVNISADAMLALREYDWPGNVRELVNIVERAVITCPGNMITTKYLPFDDSPEVHHKASDLNLREAEKFFIGLALKRTRNNKTRAAELLGISRKTLIEKVKIYGAQEAAAAAEV